MPLTSAPSPEGGANTTDVTENSVTRYLAGKRTRRTQLLHAILATPAGRTAAALFSAAAAGAEASCGTTTNSEEAQHAIAPILGVYAELYNSQTASYTETVNLVPGALSDNGSTSGVTVNYAYIDAHRPVITPDGKTIGDDQVAALASIATSIKKPPQEILKEFGDMFGAIDQEFYLQKNAPIFGVAEENLVINMVALSHMVKGGKELGIAGILQVLRELKEFNAALDAANDPYHTEQIIYYQPGAIALALLLSPDDDVFRIIGNARQLRNHDDAAFSDGAKVAASLALATELAKGDVKLVLDTFNSYHGLPDPAAVALTFSSVMDKGYSGIGRARVDAMHAYALNYTHHNTYRDVHQIPDPAAAQLTLATLAREVGIPHVLQTSIIHYTVLA